MQTIMMRRTYATRISREKNKLGCRLHLSRLVFFFFQAEDGIRDIGVTGVQTCALPIFEREPVRAFILADDDLAFAASAPPAERLEIDVTRAVMIMLPRQLVGRVDEPCRDALVLAGRVIALDQAPVADRFDLRRDRRAHALTPEGPWTDLRPHPT